MTPSNDIIRPPPRPAVSAAIFRNHGGHREMLLARRARQPSAGLYTLPGGRVEFGETLIEAVQREVLEETALTIDIIGLAGWRDVILRDSNRHFVLLSFAAWWTGGEVMLNGELDDYQWIRPERLDRFETTEGLGAIVAKAVDLAGL